MKITDNQGKTQIESITVEVLESDKTDNDLTDIIDINSVLNVISENAVNGEEVGLTVNAYDSVNLDTQIFYSLTDDGGGRFQINSETERTIKNNNLLSFKNASSHEIIVEAVSEIGHLKLKHLLLRFLDHFVKEIQRVFIMRLTTLHIKI